MNPSPEMQAFLDRAQSAAKAIEAFGKSVLFDFGDQGKVFADATTHPVTIEHAARFEQRAHCRVKTKLPVLEKLIAGDLDPMTAMFTGRLKISGDMNAALELAKKLRAADA
jgi:putative sterol carrier protein